MIVLDTSAIYAILNNRDPYNRDAKALITQHREPFILSGAVMGELTWFLETRHAPEVLDQFLRSVEFREYLVDWHPEDMSRVRELIHRYRSFPLGFVDASVIACAERLNAPVMTFDFRHFPVVAREGTFRIAE